MSVVLNRLHCSTYFYIKSQKIIHNKNNYQIYCQVKSRKVISTAYVLWYWRNSLKIRMKKGKIDLPAETGQYHNYTPHFYNYIVNLSSWIKFQNPFHLPWTVTLMPEPSGYQNCAVPILRANSVQYAVQGIQVSTISWLAVTKSGSRNSELHGLSGIT